LQAENIPVFLRPGRNDLLVYLNGESAASGSIDKSALLERSAQLKRTADETLGSVAKKPRLDENIPVVQIPYRNDLLVYLNGETAASASIGKSAPLERSAQLKRTADDTLVSVAKKPRLEETQLQMEKEQLAARLDVSKETCVTVDNVR
jgi:hypothetical protein